ncbi:MAG TPA: DUF1259 domain-containing protein [Candidatus Binatia bacterium]|nr:DUF1259 domain-containing protein [Candidatus Binatia bacterium]
MATRRVRALAALGALIAATASADGPDAALIGRLTGIEPEVSEGVVRVAVPRSDLAVTVDGVRIEPFQGLTSWAAFTGSGDDVTVMGDLALTEDQVSPVLCAALDAGLEVTALHNHFAFDHPRVMFMHVAGHGGTENLAAGVRKVLDVERGARHAPPAAGFGDPPVPAESSLTAASLEAVVGAPGQTAHGMVKFVLARRATMHGAEMGAAMGVANWAAFAGAPAAALVDGDFAAHEDELQGVLRALCRAGIHVVAIHGHMTHEEPRVVFLHFWGRGPAVDLARGIRAALDAQR